ncbi:PREDICTED: macrophage mannose receptor 1-like isoform X2 [Papilio xuthus]|uniref:Macrophage mannose receptor 1-like isoform X2 n=1 Tax=Papilio xuthus TaxID=66420 RepID=A0AAJ6ZWS8_PAPXU|nr:PREDICTED: macrophage mannose receptor 1-like isoform X2 [Papilio xuthus]
MTSFKCVVVFLFCFTITNIFSQISGNFFREDYKFIEDNRSFYKIHTISRTWKEARKMCELEGATLFYPEDQYEVESITNYWNETHSFNVIYIGVSDLVAKEVYATVDVKDVYNNWAQGEPNNSDGNEHCLTMALNGRLYDDGCDKKYNFICKKTQATIKWNDYCNVPDLEYRYSDETSRCYKLHSTPANWTEAALVCDIEHSYLAVINSEVEAQHLAMLIGDAFSTNDITPNACSSIALGFSKKDKTGWKTVLGEYIETSGYKQWAENEPDNENENKECGAMDYNGSLTSISCDAKCYFICEHENELLGYVDDRFSG